ncbi:MAG: hypothetical protein OXN90_21850 [Gemmatimonadota bacterium]|nr:hypothetical protein [Gemmatimonadota bacterium]
MLVGYESSDAAVSDGQIWAPAAEERAGRLDEQNFVQPEQKVVQMNKKLCKGRATTAERRSVEISYTILSVMFFNPLGPS